MPSQQKPGYSMAEDSYCVCTDSMATTDESSFLPFQDESCMSFRKAPDVSSRSLGRNTGGENSRVTRGGGGEEGVTSRHIGRVTQQPTLGNRK